MRIRSVSLGIVRRDENILVQVINFLGISTTFYRPIGGTIEFGENSKQTLIREFREELNQEIEEPRLISVIENIFGTADDMGHEIDFIYEVNMREKSLYELEEIEGVEGSNNYKAQWKPISYFKTDDVKLVPDGLLDLLLEENNQYTSTIKHVRTN
ncbi:NUDIX hydrolase [Paenibacillus arenosi]|uniref:NUDIX domain-containing protein n=1 Tax=Paenibacillus arenosi TaxID=2774142 RepID=A0ABR9ATP3_9BACL|nr:NUDIX domain-containing protein [Paenibacillus arenosi]MBD8497261.1 NUDIX domain-containing protein [Paenibacillus arenosi]